MDMLTEVFPLMMELPHALPNDLADEKWHQSNFHLMNLDNFAKRLDQCAM